MNDGYIQAFLKADVDWYREHLVDDFMGTLPDGSLIDKTAFLKDAASPPEIRDFHLTDLTVRVYCDTGLVQAVSNYHRKNGTHARTRYTDV